MFIRYDNCVGAFSYSTSGHNLFDKSYHLHVLMVESMPYYVPLINGIRCCTPSKYLKWVETYSNVTTDSIATGNL